MDIALPQLLAVEDYDENEGKLAASIRWLISRVYEEKRDMPDKLRDGVQRDENGHFQISESVLGALCNGSLYAQAAAKIFKESALVTKSHGAVLAALTDYGIDVLHRPEDGSVPVEESQLCSMSPFNIPAHLSIIDALMMAHLRDVLPVHRVIEAVSRHTCVEPSEKPIDSIDALLFWINKICLLVRDDVERQDADFLIPEMEDLYEDISDGQCLCALVYWYRSQEMPITDISFNEAATTRDCQYNLLLLQQFCHHHLQNDPFHFEIEDLLYLRDSLQMNVNAFLVDLFLQFEPITPEPVEVARVGPSPRRFVPASAIPDLRAANAAARSSINTRNRTRMATSQMIPSQAASRSVSRMSQDSLFYSRPSSIAVQRRSMDHDPNITDFQSLSQAYESQQVPSQVSKFDGAVNASVRLAMEEKRRKHDQQMAQLNTANENERLEKSKAAFFALRKNEEPQGNAKEEWYDRFEAKLRALELRVGLDEGEDGPQSSRLNRALSQPSVVQGSNAPYSSYMTLPMNSGAQIGQSFVQQTQPPYDYYMQQQQQQSNYANPSQLRSSLSNGMINHSGYMMPPMYPPDYQHQQQQMSMQHQGQMPVQPVGTYTPEGYFIPHPMHPIPFSSGYQQMAPSGVPYNSMPQSGQQAFMENQQIGYIQTQNKPVDFDMAQRQQVQQNHLQSQNAFHLHSENDDVTQCSDPQLEINRNLTNWGMTMHSEAVQRPQRRTWQNETFIKNELDLVNSKDAVPHVTDETTTNPEEARKLQEIAGNEIQFLNRDIGVLRGNVNNGDVESSARRSEETPLEVAQPSFVVADGEENENLEKIANERRIAKKAALIAKTMKRKEEIETKVDLAEQRNAERRQLEMEKKELALQKKLEKEQQRQKILEEYKRKKLEKELGAELSTSRSTGRGHSQPPFIRTKSQLSDATDSKPATPRMRGQSSVEQRVSVNSLGEPTHKLFAKAVTKSNRGLINNALQFSVFPGAVNNATRQATISQMAASSSKHFLILFRDQKCQYRGLYTWDEVSDTAIKISGQGPPKCTESMMNMMFKYDSGAKNFTQIATKHLSATIDGFAILDQYWQKARIPHSGNVSHRNN